jgi:hypothetical protein
MTRKTEGHGNAWPSVVRFKAYMTDSATSSADSIEAIPHAL